MSTGLQPSPGQRQTRRRTRRQHRDHGADHGALLHEGRHREALLHRDQVRARAVAADPDAPVPIITRRPSGSSVPASVPTDRRAAWRRWQNSAWAAATALVVAVVNAIGLYTGPIRFDDEGTYVSQALAVLDGSLAPYTYWYDHPPLGWILLSGWMGGPGQLIPAPHPIGTGRQAMVLLTLLSTYFLVMTVRRLGGGRVAAVGAGLAFGLSPLAIEYHRMVMLDNIAVCFLLMSWMFAATQSRRVAAAALAGAALALAVLSKETLLLMAPFVAWTTWRSYAGPTRRMCVAAFALPFTLVLAFYPLFAALRGELFAGPGHVSLQDAIVFQLFSRTPSGSIFDPASDAHAVVQGWLASDGYLLAAGLAFLIPVLLIPQTRPFGAAAALSAVTLLRPGYLPVPYVVVLLPFAAAIAGLGLESVVRVLARQHHAASPPRRIGALLAGISLIAVLGWYAVPAGREWVTRDLVYARHDFDAPYRQSTGWLLANTRRDDLIVADNVTWTDLVDGADRDPHRTVWFTKVGADPDVDTLVRTWQDIDYIVETDILRTGDPSPKLREALAHATPLRSWGEGAQRVTVLRVAR